jgi:hypothetical protein
MAIDHYTLEEDSAPHLIVDLEDAVQELVTNVSFHLGESPHRCARWA